MATVLQQLKGGHEISNDVAGIWTPEDQELLNTADQESLELLERKHGRDLVQIRKEFIAAMNG